MIWKRIVVKKKNRVHFVEGSSLLLKSEKQAISTGMTPQSAQKIRSNDFKTEEIQKSPLELISVQRDDLQQQSSNRNSHDLGERKRPMKRSSVRSSTDIYREAIGTIHMKNGWKQNESHIGIYSDTCIGHSKSLWECLAIRASPIGTCHKEIVRRSTFMLISVLTIGAGVLWSLFYVLAGERVASTLPLAYSALVCASLYYGVAERQYQAFVSLQLVLILTFPFIVHIVLGGFQASGGVMLWSFLSPFGASFFRSAKESIRWFQVYVLLSALLMTSKIHYHPLASTTKPSCMTPVEDVFFAVNILGVAVIVFTTAHTFAKELEKEYERSERLLHNILPSSISRRIKDGEVPIIDRHEEVTILFADIVGFTSASTTMCPNLLIGEFLRDFFAKADELVDVRGLEKIKTIGDAYMVVGGLFKQNGGNPASPNESDHAVDVIDLAAEMFDVLEEVNKKHGMSFQIRIGIHTGPVIAGVLGVKKFAYDVWGDAVNTASRMESNGKAGYIHLSQQSYKKVQHLRDSFEFSSCGELQIKGKGAMVTYLARPIHKCGDYS